MATEALPVAIALAPDLATASALPDVPDVEQDERVARDVQLGEALEQALLVMSFSLSPTRCGIGPRPGFPNLAVNKC